MCIALRTYTANVSAICTLTLILILTRTVYLRCSGRLIVQYTMDFVQWSFIRRDAMHRPSTVLVVGRCLSVWQSRSVQCASVLFPNDSRYRKILSQPRHYMFASIRHAVCHNDMNSVNVVLAVCCEYMPMLNCLCTRPTSKHLFNDLFPFNKYRARQ